MPVQRSRANLYPYKLLCQRQLALCVYPNLKIIGSCFVKSDVITRFACCRTLPAGTPTGGVRYSRKSKPRDSSDVIRDVAELELSDGCIDSQDLIWVDHLSPRPQNYPCHHQAFWHRPPLEMQSFSATEMDPSFPEGHGARDPRFIKPSQKYIQKISKTQHMQWVLHCAKTARTKHQIDGM